MLSEIYVVARRRHDPMMLIPRRRLTIPTALSGQESRSSRQEDQRQQARPQRRNRRADELWKDGDARDATNCVEGRPGADAVG